MDSRKDEIVWRIIIDPSATGSWNMAIDDALFNLCTAGKLSSHPSAVFLAACLFISWTCPTHYRNRPRTIIVRRLGLGTDVQLAAGQFCMWMS